MGRFGSRPTTGPSLQLPFDAVQRAKLILTDELIAASTAQQ